MSWSDGPRRAAVWPLTQAVHAVATCDVATWRQYREGLRFRAAAAGWSAARRDEWRLQALRRAVRQAYDTTPLYRRLWADRRFDLRTEFGYDEFATLPIVHRADLQGAAEELLSSAVRAPARRRDATGGSTGQPLALWTGPEERGWRASGTEIFFRRLGVPTGVRTAYIWGHHLDPGAHDSLATRLVDLAAGRTRLEALRLSPEVLSGYHRRLQAMRPACVVAYASTLGDLAMVIDAEGGPAPCYPRRCFVTGGEKLYRAQRELVERVFRRPVHERYGSRDVGNMAFQFDPTGAAGLEVDWALVHLEPATAERMAPVLVTKLHGDAMPLVRYAVDDLARFPSGSRPGWPVLQLEEVLGRTVDRIVLPDGRWLHGFHFPHLMKDFPVREFQVTQSRDLAVEVRLVPGASFTAAHLAAIERTLRANLAGVPLTVVEVAAIERTRANKWRPVVSEA